MTVKDLESVSDAELLACSSDLGGSFAVFYRRHVRAVLAFLAARGVEPQRAADLTAETFAAALVGRRTFRGSDRAARGWVLGIASNKLAESSRRWHRDRRLLERLQIEAATATPADVLDYEQLHRPGGADRLLESLPEGQRQFVAARVIDGQAYEEIAATHDVSEATARQRVSRGLATLRNRWEPEA